MITTAMNHSEPLDLDKPSYTTDEVSLTQTRSLYDTWAADTDYEADSIIKHNGTLYRVVQAVTSLESQAPDAEGMLAIYRPIVIEAAGTLESPIPWVYGMDCYTDKYYSYNEKIYLCKGDMIPCVWEPGTAGLWQWEEVTA